MGVKYGLHSRYIQHVFLFKSKHLRSNQHEGSGNRVAQRNLLRSSGDVEIDDRARWSDDLLGGKVGRLLEEQKGVSIVQTNRRVSKTNTRHFFFGALARANKFFKG